MSNKWRIFCLILGIVIFGMLMAVRPEFQSMWWRALVAAVAFVALFVGICQFRKKHG